MKTSKLSLSLILAAAFAQGAMAQNLLEEKPVYTLGEAKTWTSSTDVEYTFKVEDLAKLTAYPINTSNIYLFPEAGGGWNTEANREIGIQGFYVDLGESQAIGTVSTTWEGAAASSFDIYLTDDEPTLDILKTTPTYSATGLGQFTANTVPLPDGSKGRYLVFQGTDATAWGWGVKIRSISAEAPQTLEFAHFTVSPAIAIAGEETKITLTTLDQFNLPLEGVEISVSDNATLEDGILVIESDDFATITAKYGDKILEAVVYVATAPALPIAEAIKTPIFTNTVTEFNGKVNFTYGYNGGATNYGLYTFENGEVAQGFGNTRCVFFSNAETTGAWNGNINPEENGYTGLCFSIFATRDVEGNVNFEGTSDPEKVPVINPFTLKAGEWNDIVVKIEGVTKLNNMSVRFTEENASDLLLANIYFTAGEVESGVSEFAAEEGETVIYNLQGIRVNEALSNLPAGLYIVNGKKVAVR